MMPPSDEFGACRNDLEFIVDENRHSVWNNVVRLMPLLNACFEAVSSGPPVSSRTDPQRLRSNPPAGPPRSKKRTAARPVSRNGGTNQFAGAMRYAAEQTGRDPNFTKFPANWLNGGCWQDESDEPVAPLRGAPPCAIGSELRVDPVQQWLEGRRSRDDEEFEHEQDRAASFRR
jgi:hypothetical protein